ncbi:decapping endonuclease targeting mRNA [Aspergillus terreus]
MNRTGFDIQPIGRFYASNTTIRRPKEIACFSYDDEHSFHLGDSSLRYYYPPKLPADLNQGFDEFQKLDDSGDEHLDALLETIMALEKETGKTSDADIITWRGMMTKVRNECHLFSGYKFETLSVINQPWDPTSREEIEGRPELVVNNKAQYCSVVRTGIGSTKLIIGGEVDAVWDCKPDRKEDPIHWVELKTSAEIRNDRDMLKYERKLLKFWAQSFLLGVPKIIVGFRDQYGIVHRLEELETASIPVKVKKAGKGTWDGNICINFAAAFLEWRRNVEDTKT